MQLLRRPSNYEPANTYGVQKDWSERELAYKEKKRGDQRGFVSVYGLVVHPLPTMPKPHRAHGSGTAIAKKECTRALDGAVTS